MTKGGETILTCLREVDHSRPYFVGLLGERYGWHQENDDGKDSQLLKTFQKAESVDEYHFIVVIYFTLLFFYINKRYKWVEQ